MRGSSVFVVFISKSFLRFSRGKTGKRDFFVTFKVVFIAVTKIAKVNPREIFLSGHREPLLRMDL
jgi:hypothetical protein